MSSAGRSYLDEVLRLLGEVRDTQESAIADAAGLVANTVSADGLVHLFGTGHSHLLAAELFYRAGGLAQVNPILVAPLMLHAGAARSTQLERLSGLAEELISAEPVGADDVMIIVSNSGGNATCIEMALAARSRGISTIALTSMQHATAPRARDQGGPRLHEVVDVVLDNQGRPGDACVTLPGLGQPVGPTSTSVGAAILNAVVAQAVEILVERGETPDIFVSSNLADGDRVNEALINRYRPTVRAL
ncbi:MAG TPA: SIS domain-containing protein [Actinomycetes bacterium]|nr:SIS domain-containing protein [Actinomycetes bacterium]